MKISELHTFNKEWVKDETVKKTRKILKEIGELQNKMYAQNKYSIIVVLQGLDASGKDGLAKGLLSYCNPIGLEVYSFKKPTDLEYSHDFLWRIHQVCPAKGVLQVFIRSHYEDILVPSVEKFIPAAVIEKRYEAINIFEKMLEESGTKVLKFFLNVSKEVQKERLMERIEVKEKHWKHKDGDWDTREKFDQYMKVYQNILTRCNEVPWTAVPADKNWQKLYAVAEVLLKTLKELPLEWPELVSEKFTAPVKQKKEAKSPKSAKSVKPVKAKVSKVPKV
jgi:PPK2 family polyphosphate:nucleotide phosphotransferase